ncbi:WD repeat-containing protein 6 [Saxophila tyrrhenica]|uniref:WD repeat-containing protein 6 n=1 Tax=Saxophila tyrrhenica TaxID=1690608 RepID=A0AAV9PDL5_9PEZI|nr:WD repeat-containing protein 6 [Saxophila tyrrhenica]
MQHENHHVPVTALAFYNDSVLLAGQGNYLHAYQIADKTLVATQLVFKRQAIHGIILNEEVPSTGLIVSSTGLLCGGSLCRRFDVRWSGSKLDVVLHEVLDVQDWILDASFAHASRTVAVVTAHNALWLNAFRDANEDGRSTSHERLIPGSNCILYSAHVKWLSPSTCLIAAGTAFGDIILWSATLEAFSGKWSAESQIHFTFPAHAGSVFGVQISPWVFLPGSREQQRLLASCSDDRNIKLWGVSDLSARSPALTQIQHETGFNAKPEQANSTAPPLMAKVMGHISRIWHIRFGLVGADSALKTIRSFGEDASCIQWDLTAEFGSDPLPYALKQANLATAHAGKNIWTIASTAAGMLATGGADGAIALYNAGQTSQCSRSLLEALDNDDTLKSYGFVGHDTLVSTTWQGRILLLDLSSTGDMKVSSISEPVPGLRGYSIVESVADAAFLAGMDGCVYAYGSVTKQLSKVAETKRKTAGLFACRDVSDTVYLLITTVGETSARLLSLDACNGSVADVPATDATLALPVGFIVTGFTFYATGDERYAILGARNGSMAVFALSGGSPDFVPPVHVFDELHSREAVTSLRCVTTAADEGQTYVLSTGRDGTFAIHRMLFHPTGVEIRLLHQLLLPFGPNIEALHITPENDVWVWGFKSKHFTVYSISAQREIMTVDCGGAHRNWTFQPTASGGTFIWTKASQVYRETQTSLPYDLLNTGNHGREIKALAITPPSTARQILATGAEDTDIKLFTLANTNEFECIHTLRKHNTGIQDLQWSSNGHYLFSSGGFEEFFVWRVEAGLPFVDLGVVCESKHPRSGRSDLRVMGFEVSEEREGFVVRMAYSDSTVKIWRYAGRTWSLLASADYLIACLTNIIPLPSQGDDFLTTATDGHITHWSPQPHLRWTSRHRVHQNAILATTSFTLPDGDRLVVTGGDDNAIAFSLFTSDNQLHTSILRRAHAAAVTGLALIPTNDTTAEFRLVSVSIDQRLKLWSISISVKAQLAGTAGGTVEGEWMEVKKLQDVFTAVADVSGVEVCRLPGGGTGVLGAGVGMGVWRVPPSLLL